MGAANSKQKKVDLLASSKKKWIPSIIQKLKLKNTKHIPKNNTLSRKISDEEQLSADDKQRFLNNGPKVNEMIWKIGNTPKKQSKFIFNTEEDHPWSQEKEMYLPKDDELLSLFHLSVNSLNTLYKNKKKSFSYGEGTMHYLENLKCLSQRIHGPDSKDYLRLHEILEFKEKENERESIKKDSKNFLSISPMRSKTLRSSKRNMTFTKRKSLDYGLKVTESGINDESNNPNCFKINASNKNSKGRENGSKQEKRVKINEEEREISPLQQLNSSIIFLMVVTSLDKSFRLKLLESKKLSKDIKRIQGSKSDFLHNFNLQRIDNNTSVKKLNLFDNLRSDKKEFYTSRYGEGKLLRNKDFLVFVKEKDMVIRNKTMVKFINDNPSTKARALTRKNATVKHDFVDWKLKFDEQRLNRSHVKKSKALEKFLHKNTIGRKNT